jgi:hypothetical protein
MLREATYPPAAVNVLDVSSESMAALQVFSYGRFWVFTEVLDESGLPEAIRWYTQGLTERSGLIVDLNPGQRERPFFAILRDHGFPYFTGITPQNLLI